MRSLLAPRYWGGHLLMLAAVAAAIALGVWQLGVWQSDRAIEARDLSNAAPRPLNDVMGPDAPFPGEDLGRPVRFSGTWLPTTLYVADRESAGRRGFWVVGAVRVSGTDSAMPVVRGWSPTADVASASGAAEVTGWLQAGEGKGLSDHDRSDNVLPEMRVASLVEKIDLDIYGGYVVDKAPSAGLAKVTPQDVPKVAVSHGLRNFLYGIQWFIFGGFAVVMWRRWCKDQLAEHVVDAG